MARRGWQRKPETSIKDLKGEAARVEDTVDPQYDEYLALLQERNRILKRMEKKSKAKAELQRKEAGFSLYVNGANLPKTKGRPASDTRTSPSKNGSSHFGRELSNSPHLNSPTPSRRRTWAPRNVQIRSGQGERRVIAAPSLITGSYDDDFDIEVKKMDQEKKKDTSESESDECSAKWQPTCTDDTSDYEERADEDLADFAVVNSSMDTDKSISDEISDSVTVNESIAIDKSESSFKTIDTEMDKAVICSEPTTCTATEQRRLGSTCQSYHGSVKNQSNRSRSSCKYSDSKDFAPMYDDVEQTHQLCQQKEMPPPNQILPDICISAKKSESLYQHSEAFQSQNDISQRCSKQYTENIQHNHSDDYHSSRHDLLSSKSSTVLNSPTEMEMKQMAELSHGASTYKEICSPNMGCNNSLNTNCATESGEVQSHRSQHSNTIVRDGITSFDDSEENVLGLVRERTFVIETPISTNNLPHIENVDIPKQCQPLWHQPQNKKQNLNRKHYDDHVRLKSKVTKGKEVSQARSTFATAKECPTKTDEGFFVEISTTQEHDPRDTCSNMKQQGDFKSILNKEEESNKEIIHTRFILEDPTLEPQAHVQEHDTVNNKSESIATNVQAVPLTQNKINNPTRNSDSSQTEYSIENRSPVHSIPFNKPKIIKKSKDGSLQAGFSKLKRYGKVISIQPISTYTTWAIGSIEIGLSKVELLDEFYHTIPPGPTTWMASINDVYDQHVYTLLVEGLPNTINADDMWLGSVKDNTWPTISIYFTEEIKPAAVRIWNYNRPNCETAGMKEVVIKDKNNELLWKGCVPKGTGRRNKPVHVEAELQWPTQEDLGSSRDSTAADELRSPRPVQAEYSATSLVCNSDNPKQQLEEKQEDASPSKKLPTQVKSYQIFSRGDDRKCVSAQSTTRQKIVDPETNNRMRTSSAHVQQSLNRRLSSPALWLQGGKQTVANIEKEIICEDKKLAYPFKHPSSILTSRNSRREIAAAASAINIPEIDKTKSAIYSKSIRSGGQNNNQPAHHQGKRVNSKAVTGEGQSDQLKNEPTCESDTRHGHILLRGDQHLHSTNMHQQGKEKSRSDIHSFEQDSLRKSLEGLTVFNRTHASRIDYNNLDFEVEARFNHSIELQTDNTSEVNCMQSSVGTDALESSFQNLPESASGILVSNPMGRVLKFQLLSTWGDAFYVGLTGIQVFSETGEIIVVKSIRAEPPDLRIVAGYGSDPRIVENLIDGVNYTRDAMHMWMCPWLGSKHTHIITMELFESISIGAIRIWNYNESRTTSHRGVRDIDIQVDGVCIFRGEVRQSSGSLFNPYDLFELILFKEEESFLRAIMHQDRISFRENAGKPLGSEEHNFREQKRPPTRGSDVSEFQSSDDVALDPIRNIPSQFDQDQSKERQHFELPVLENTEMNDEDQYTSFIGTRLQLNFTATWGDAYYLGLSGIELFDADGSLIPVDHNQVEAIPRDLNELVGVEGDVRTVDNLFDGINVTCDDTHMWLVPFTPQGDHLITFYFNSPTFLGGIRLYNYNKSTEDIYRGVKLMSISIDDRCVSPPEGLVIRIAPGVADFDFGQWISFQHLTKLSSNPQQQVTGYSRVGWDKHMLYAMPLEPIVSTVTFRLLSTCGDVHYIGLNGIEFLDPAGECISVLPSQLFAVPESINCLPEVTKDPRTPDKLLSNHMNGQDECNAWLAPFDLGTPNRIFVLFAGPVTLGAIKIWNYFKTPSRGVRHLQVWADGRILFEGFLEPVRRPLGAGNAPFNTDITQDDHQTIIFSSYLEGQPDKDLRPLGPYREQHINFINDGVALSQLAPYRNPLTASRPRTSVA